MSGSSASSFSKPFTESPAAPPAPQPPNQATSCLSSHPRAARSSLLHPGPLLPQQGGLGKSGVETAKSRKQCGDGKDKLGMTVHYGTNMKDRTASLTPALSFQHPTGGASVTQDSATQSWNLTSRSAAEH